MAVFLLEDGASILFVQNGDDLLLEEVSGPASPIGPNDHLTATLVSGDPLTGRLVTSARLTGRLPSA